MRPAWKWGLGLGAVAVLVGGAWWVRRRLVDVAAPLGEIDLGVPLERAPDVSPDADLPPTSPGGPEAYCLLGGPGGSCPVDPLEDPRWAPVARSIVPASSVPSSSTWPVLTKHGERLVVSYWTAEGPVGRSGRAFAASRVDDDGRPKLHAGIDLGARDGDLVVAPEDGRIIAVLPFNNGTDAVYLRSSLDPTRVINLGEVRKGSPREIGVKPGVVVQQGDALARIGVQSGGSTMLHAEIYQFAATASDEEIVAAIRAGKLKWFEPDMPPAELRDPTDYLLAAALRTHRLEQLLA